METWRPVVSWEGLYEVSDLGRVRRIVPSNGRPPGLMKNTFIGSNGYAGVHLRFCGRNARPTVHKVVAAAFIGPRALGQQVNHKDGNRLNNALQNLEYVTCGENHTHAYRVLGRRTVSNSGERNGNSKLKLADVAAIRSRYAPGSVSLKTLGAEYGVSKTMIRAIVLGKNWKRAATP